LTTVNDLLGVDTKMVAMNFPPDQLLATQGAGFSNNADALVVSDTLARAYQTAAETFAAQAVANLAPLLGCDPATGDACAKTFIASFGRRAFRRPMTADEQTAYFTLFKTGSTAPEGTTFADGISLVLQTFLQSPNFLYRVEHGAPATPTAAVAPVTSFEMATRLSYFFWGTGPDNMLLDLAQANQLQTPAQVQMAITTLLKSPRAQSAVSNFHNEWLSLLAITGVTKDATMFPDWTPAIALDMNNEAQTFADQVFWNDGKSDTLFNAPYTFVNAELAKFYGMPAPTGSGFVKVNVDPSRRLGMMMMGGILAFNAKPNQTSPVHRGKFVREQLLCGTVPPPPANVVITPPQVTPGSTTRQRFAQHEKDPTCAGCHVLMDGMGLGFEHYDPTGRWRDTDQGLPVDDSGNVVGTTDVNGAFHGGVELAGKFATSQQVRECVVKQWFRAANGRAEDTGDACTLATLNQSFEQSGHDMRDLRVKIATSDAFMYRSMAGGGQ
jgi:hypothetical protein